MATRVQIRPPALTVAFWNACGLKQQRNELEAFCADFNVDVMLVNETHLRPGDDPRLANYRLYRADRLTRQGGGVAAYVKNSIEHHQLTTPPLNNIEACTVYVNTSFGGLQFSSIYKPPSAPLDTQDLDALFSTRVATLLAGDFNCKHLSWNSRRANTNGRVLRAYADQHDLSVHGPSEPTYYAATGLSSDVLDICVTRDVKVPLELFTVNELSSDHNPVLLVLNGVTDDVATTTTRQRVDWTEFTASLEEGVVCNSPTDTPEELDSAVEALTVSVKTALQAASHVVNMTKPSRFLPAHIRELMRLKRRARRNWHRTRAPSAKTSFNRLTRMVHSALSDWKNERWESFVNTLSPDNGSLWRIAKSLRNRQDRVPPIHGEHGVAHSDIEKAEAFVDSLERQCSPNYSRCDLDFVEQVHREVRRFLRSARPVVPAEDVATPREIRDVLDKLALRKAPGPDGIGNRALRHFGRRATVALCNVVNGALRTGYFPRPWKAADVIFIPKGAENRSFPQNYRPISLLCTMAKVLEHVILLRLRKEAEERKIIPDDQHGFRQAHSTCHQLLRLVEYAIEGWHFNMRTGVILLDIKKAFDTVWHKGLLHKVLMAKFPEYLVVILASYLRDRSIRARVGSTLSSSRQISAGVPQGSLLAPLLYLLFTHDMPTEPGTIMCKYADDTAIVTRHKQVRYIERKLQAAADLMESYFDRWRIEINGSKSRVIVFAPRRSQQAHGEITLCQEVVPWVKQVRYLGVTLDAQLNWSAHVQYIRDKVLSARQILRPLIGRRSKLSLANKLLIFKTAIRPIITYACPVWAYGLSASAWLKLAPAQTTCLRELVDAPWFVANKQIERDLDLSDVKSHILSLAAEWLLAAKSHENPLVRAALDYGNTPEMSHRRPGSILPG